METSFDGSVYTAHTLGQGLALCGGHAGPGRAAGVDSLGWGLDWRLSLRAWRCSCLRAIVLRRGGAIGQLLRRARTCNRRSLRSCCRRRFRARRLGLIGLCAIDASLLGGGCGGGRERGAAALFLALGTATLQLQGQRRAHLFGLRRTECVRQVFIGPGGQGPALNLACGRVCSDLALGGLLLGWRACGFLCGLGQSGGLLGLGGRAGIHCQGSSCGQRASSRIQAHFLGRTLRANGGINARGIQLRGGRDVLLAQPGLVDDRLLLSGQLPHEFIAHRRQARRHFSIGMVLADLLEQIWAESLVQRVRRGFPVLGRQGLVLSSRQRFSVLLLALWPHYLVDGGAVGCNVWQARRLGAGLLWSSICCLAGLGRAVLRRPTVPTSQQRRASARDATQGRTHASSSSYTLGWFNGRIEWHGRPLTLVLRDAFLNSLLSRLARPCLRRACNSAAREPLATGQ
ncbi:hypothetical protein [Delftia lacustris]|uniref:hypothetical protein n=1 Tax=Delftia lacustris TaxID=558537 RepID=UPI001FCACE4B|nr:hypothetical protein [Delftia lacustris]